MNGEDESIEFLAFNRQLFAASGRQSVVPRPPIVLGSAPLGLDPPSQQEPLQGGVQRTLAHLEHVIRHVLEVLDNAIAVRSASDERLQDEQVERAGEEFRRVFRSHRLSMGEWRSLGPDVKSMEVPLFPSHRDRLATKFRCRPFRPPERADREQKGSQTSVQLFATQGNERIELRRTTGWHVSG
jgi:hypothetical protein